MTKHFLLFAASMLILVMLVCVRIGRTQKSLSSIQEKELSPGIYLLRVDKPLRVPANWDVHKVSALGVIGRDYIHKGVDPKTKKECGGDVKRGVELTDEGTVFLKCQKCGREWIAKEAEPH